MNKMLFAALLLTALAVQPVCAAPITSQAVSPATISEEMGALESAQRADYAKKMMGMISSMPVNPETKATAFANAAVALVDKAGGAAKPDVVGAIFSSIPLQYIGAVSEAFATPFNQANNNLSDAAYDSIAERIISATEARIRADRADTPIARLTVVTALFVRGSSNPDRTKEAYLNYLPKDENLRKTVIAWLPSVVAGDFSKIAAAGSLKELTELPPVAEKPTAVKAPEEKTKSDAELRQHVKHADDEARPPILERNIYDSLALLSDSVIETDQMFGLRVPTGLNDPSASYTEPGNPGIGMPSVPPVLPPGVDPVEPEPPPPYRGQRTSR